MRLRNGKIIHRFNVHAKEFKPRFILNSNAAEFKPKESLSEVQPTEPIYINKSTDQKMYIMYNVKNIDKNLCKI